MVNNFKQMKQCLYRIMKMGESRCSFLTYSTVQEKVHIRCDLTIGNALFDLREGISRLAQETYWPLARCEFTRQFPWAQSGIVQAFYSRADITKTDFHNFNSFSCSHTLTNGSHQFWLKVTCWNVGLAEWLTNMGCTTKSWFRCGVFCVCVLVCM